MVLFILSIFILLFYLFALNVFLAFIYCYLLNARFEVEKTETDQD